MEPHIVDDVPNQPKTPGHSVRLKDELWQRIVATAKAEGITASDVVRRALEDALAERESERED